MSFDLKKFLTENKLTNTSRITLEISEKATINEIEINGRRVDLNTAEVDGIEPSDYPDFSNAYIGYIEFEDGTPLNSEELDMLMDKHYGLASELVHDRQLYTEISNPIVDESPAETSDVSKYINLGSAEEVIKEIESEVSRVTLEAKISKIKEVIEAIENKANGLEEDTNLQGFVNPSRIREMRRMSKKLRIMQERYSKDFDKKFNKKKK
jgi:hypothetical protein